MRLEPVMRQFDFNVYTYSSGLCVTPDDVHCEFHGGRWVIIDQDNQEIIYSDQGVIPTVSNPTDKVSLDDFDPYKVVYIVFRMFEKHDDVQIY